MNYNARSIIDKSQIGESFENIDDSLDWLLSQAMKKGYDAEVRAELVAEGTTRFGVSQITQHTDIFKLIFNLKLSKGKKFAAASFSVLRKQGLQALLNNVIQGLKSTPDIKFYQGLPSPRPGTTINMSGKEWTIEDRTDAVLQSVQAAEEVSPNVIIAGTATERKVYKRILSTEDVDVEDAYQNNYFKVNAICGEPNRRGYGQEEIYWRYDEPNYTVMAEEATRTALDTIDQLNMDAPKKYEVLLGPQAVADLIIFVLLSADATSFHETNSFTSDRLGDQIFDKKLTIENLPRNTKQATIVSSFDYEGLTTKNQTFFDRGVLKFIPYDSFYAAKYLKNKNAATAHLMPFPWGVANFPVSAVISPGNKTLEEQISEIKNGLYVKNFWYNRFTIRREGGLTGLTRNGLYNVKNGEIKNAVRNLRYTESFVSAFSPGNIISLSSETRNFLTSNVPSIHLKSYQFSSIAHTNV